MTLAASLLTALKAHGAREIFGIPGDFALPLFDAIERSGILPLYTLSHEPAVGYAADAAARINGGLGVAAVTYGAGAFNLINAVAGAYAERSPVVVLSGAPSRAERAGGLLLHHQAKTIESQFRVYLEITCDQAVLDDPATAGQQVARVLRSCRDRSLPVYIEVPSDMPDRTCAFAPAAAATAFDGEAAAACAAEVIERLAAAKSPVLMVGVEVRRFGLEDKVARLARRLGVPVVTSFMGRGLLADMGSQVLGTYLGLAGKPEISDLVEGADALLLLGVIISDTNFGVSARHIDLRKAIHAFDGHVRIGHYVYPTLPLAALVEAMLERIPDAGEGAAAPQQRSGYPGGLVADDAPVRPADIACAINDLMRRHGPLPIACDVGDCLFTAMDIDHTHLVAPGYYAGMGFGVPAGLGLQATTGQRPLILVGDGAFQMTGWELGNCRRYGWDPIVLVFNNCSWEMLRVFDPQAAFNDRDDWHFADIAASLGGAGVRVRTRIELRDALAEAHAARGRFRLIEIMLERGAISETLARFVAAFRKRADAGPTR
jgi:indolepyruvate decarboxylase